ncbi:hypothetical protein ACFYZT_32025 [Streptomyces sp. NPDC001591]|uniref:hypothetical protein n=1 Tax=Streptomyces sp. NPDC001591 TaxID=3364589 RepID=UPI0036B0B7E0
MDRRLIQTAVLGSPDSDEPVVCPEDADDLRIFRREHENDTWWCGIHLPGGCGRRLMTRLCTDKVCHFAHYREDGTEYQCGRQSSGPESANHLFVKADFAGWLDAQGIRGGLTFPEPVGSAVAARLEDGRMLLIHLDRSRPVAWNDPAYWEIVLGPGVRMDPDVLSERGSIYRLRFDARAGGRRATQIRMETPKPTGSPEWMALDKLLLTEEGLTLLTQPDAAPRPGYSTHETTRADRAQRQIIPILPSASTRGPDPRRPSPVRTAALRLDSALRADDPQRVREALHAATQPMDRTDRQDAEGLDAALARAKRWQDQRARRCSAVVAALLEDAAGGRLSGALLAQAVQLVQDADTPENEKSAVAEIQARAQRAREEARREQVKEAAAREAAEARDLARRVADVARTRREFQLQADYDDRRSKLTSLADFVRGALRKAAGEGRVTTWPELGQKTGRRELYRLSYLDQLDVLALVDAQARPEDPRLSALLDPADDAAALRLHRDVCRRLGRPVPESDADLLDQLTTERAKLHGW